MNTDIPFPREAMIEAVRWARQADALMARLWLDIARELREGATRPAETAGERAASLIREASLPGHLPIDETAVIKAQQENTEVIRPPVSNFCPACEREVFTVSGGKTVHRSTYRVECEPAFSVR